MSRFVAALLAVLALPSSALAVTEQEAEALGGEAYLYGFPLLEFERMRATLPCNAFAHATRFATPADRDIVAPNNDTLYSSAFLDLRKGPVVLRHPAMGKRYFSFQFLDPYTNTVGYVGSRTTGSKAGRFVLTKKKYGAKRLWVIGRTLATDTPKDRRRALRLMRRYRLDGARCTPPAEQPELSGLGFLDALAAAMADSPPPAGQEEILDRIAAARAEQPDALARGVDASAASLPGAALAQVLQGAAAAGGWATPLPIIGDYGTDFTYSAGVAALGLGANTPDEAMYPTALLDSDGQLLSGAHRYRITFAQEPPARAFWSLTMYDLDGFLVRNAARRYAIGDSHPPLRRRADGSVVVVIQSERPTEPGVNWLPPPAGPFRLNLRLYVPTQAALGGDWKPPPVVRTD
jgi:hypothetical protein